MKREHPVIVVGGGLAGLTAASCLRNNDVPVVLFEAAPTVAGLGQSFTDEDGFTYDMGAHFITNRLAKKIGIEDRCRTVKRYGETVWLGDHSYSQPFGLMRIPRMSLGGIRAKIGLFGGITSTPSAADTLRAMYGRPLADEVAIPLTEAMSGAKAPDLSAAAAEGLAGGIARTIWLRTVSRLTGRAIACGYSRELPETASVHHVYPEGGIGTICRKLADGLDGIVRLNSPVEAILVENERAVGVRVGGTVYEASAVISTAPVHILAKIVEGTTRLGYLARFRYRPMIFVNMRFTGRSLLPDLITWTPEDRFPFLRVTETPIAMPWLAPDSMTLITADIGCETDDKHWLMDDDSLGELCVDSLRPIVPDARRRYAGCRVLRTPIAYPVFLSEYETERQQFDRGTGIDGLLSIGRNGEFQRILMEDVHHRTIRKVEELVRQPDAASMMPARPHQLSLDKTYGFGG